MAAGYSAYQAPVGTAQDPYAAYAYALSHQTSQPGLAAYQVGFQFDTRSNRMVNACTVHLG